jgi:hypothetical protein
MVYRLYIIALALVAAVAAQAEDPWADAVLEYTSMDPESGFTDPQRALGEPLGGLSLATPNNDDVVSLGIPGSRIVLKFDTPVTDDPANPMGLDCIVYSNAFWVGGNPQVKFQEPAIIEISRDVNGNGLADDPWYLIPGSRGFAANPFPVVNEPAGINNEPPFDPTLLAGRIRNPNSTDGNSATDNTEYNWGYAELTPTAPKYLDNFVRPDDPFAVGLTARSGGGDAFDIAWAVDSSGQPANLSEFHFIRITSLVNRQLGTFGKASSEIAGVADVAAAVDSDGDGILDDYEIRVSNTDPYRPESTVLPLEIPFHEGGSPAGALLGEASDANGNAIRLFSTGPRTLDETNVIVDITSVGDPGPPLPDVSAVKSLSAREYSSSESDFIAAEVDTAQFVFAYTSSDILAMDEPSLQPWRFSGGMWTQSGISEIAVNTQANQVTFRSRFAGIFILGAPGGSGDDDAPGPSGSIALTAAPPNGVIANPANTVTVTSGVILDQDSNVVNDGTLITVATTLGTITTADADGGVAGVQVPTSGGTISFSVQAPTQSGTASITAGSVQGSAFGELLYNFTPAPPAPPVHFRSLFNAEPGPVFVTLGAFGIADEFGNVVPDGTLITIVPDGVEITSADVDPNANGHQAAVDDGRVFVTVEAANRFDNWSIASYTDPGLTVQLSDQTFGSGDMPELPLHTAPWLIAALLGAACFALRKRGRGMV